MEGDNNSWDRFITIDIFLSVGAQALEGIQRPKYAHFLFASELSQYHTFLSTHISFCKWAIGIFAELFLGISDKEIRKSKVGDKLVEINNGLLPKIQEPESNSKDACVYI